MLRKPPWGEEHHWKIISLSDTLLISIPLLVTLQPRDREKVTRAVCAKGWHLGNLAVTPSPTPNPSMGMDKSFIPLCLTTPHLGLLLHGLFNICFYAFNKGVLLVWVARSLIVLSRCKPWIQAEVSNQQVLMCELSLWYSPCHFAGEHRYFSKLEMTKYFSCWMQRIPQQTCLSCAHFLWHSAGI